MSDIDYLMLEAEREELLRRLTSGALDNLGIIERSFERRALRQRLTEVEAELNDNLDADWPDKCKEYGCPNDATSALEDGYCDDHSPQYD